MKTYLLRDLKKNTELVILSELLRNPSIRRKELADRLGVTEQAVSQYFIALESERLITPTRGSLRPTVKGRQMLQEGLFGLRDEIDGILREIELIDTCLAIADAPIRAKDAVGLLMRGGKLYAVPGIPATSRGIARNDAEEGSEVLVGNLEGVVELELGKLLALQLPSESSGGSKIVDVGRGRSLIGDFQHDLSVAGDLIGEIVAHRMGLDEGLVIHAPVESALNALSKGLNVLFLGTRESITGITSAIDRLKIESGYEFDYKILNVGVVKRQSTTPP